MAPPAADRPLPITRGHLFAFAALALALAALTFFLGLTVGRRQAAAPPPAAVSALVPEEVRSGDLEVLLSKVEEARPGEGLAFPEELPRSTALVVPSASDGVPTSGFAIEVFVRPDETDAQRLVDTLRAAGLAAYRVAAMVDGKAEHRVKVGGYASEEAAKAALAEVQARAGAPEASVGPVP